MKKRMNPSPITFHTNKGANPTPICYMHFKIQQSVTGTTTIIVYELTDAYSEHILTDGFQLL